MTSSLLLTFVGGPIDGHRVKHPSEEEVRERIITRRGARYNRGETDGHVVYYYYVCEVGRKGEPI